MTVAADPLLRAVLDAPDDDLPRLIYADALDAGDCPGVPRDASRAEFVRVQVELATLESHKHHIGEGQPALVQRLCEVCQRREGLRRRERGLLKEYGRGWAGDALRPGLTRVRRPEDGAVIMADTDRLPVVFTAPDGRQTIGEAFAPYAFRRGFVAEITCTAADWLAHGDAILAACPVRGKRYEEEPHYREPSRDGLVRLTTEPDVLQQTVGVIDPPPGWRGPARIRGRSPWRLGEDLRWEDLGRPASEAAWLLALLAAEWPGVNFQLPSPVSVSAR